MEHAHKPSPPWRASARFVTGAARASQLPPPDLPEAGFAGRSNVGKSSLLNAAAGIKTLARTSATPGRTREVNFFLLQDKSAGLALYLVDLPGYGYAKAPKTEARRWSALLRDYLMGRASLRRVFLLIDARRGLMPGDQNILEMLKEAGVSTQVLLTKCDKLDAKELAGLAVRLKKDLKPYIVTHPEIIPTSARTGEGIAKVREALRALAGR